LTSNVRLLKTSPIKNSEELQQWAHKYSPETTSSH
jgi:hypothetical protein